MDGQRKALIVANDEYEQQGLRRLFSAAADADALGQVLGDGEIGGFDVRVVRNEPAHVISTHIEDLFSDARPDDVLLLHFSCHGLKSESGELFFAARNTRPNRLGSTAVPADFVQRCMRASRSRSIVLLLDCCYGGAFSQGVSVRAAGDVNVFDSFPGGRLGGGRGRAVITASSAMEYAFEGDHLADEQGRAPSVFTAALVEGLRSGDADRDEDGWVCLNELYDYVFDQVRARNPHQTPSRDVEMQGDLYLARSGRRRVRPLPIPADLRQAITDGNMFTRLGAVTELRSRLVSDNVAVATGAHEALEEIAGSDIQYVADAAAQALREAAIRVEPALTPPERLREPAEPRAEPADALPEPAVPLPAAAVPAPRSPLATAAAPDAPGRLPWWLVVALALCAAVLVVVNWPGAEYERLAWLEENTGWHLYRRPFDPFIVGSFLALAGALGALATGRRWRLALSAVAGSGLFLAVDASVFLLSRVGAVDRSAWFATVAVGAVVAAAALVAARPVRRPARRVSLPAGALVLVGAALVVAHICVGLGDVTWLLVSRGFGILAPLTVVAVTWVALSTGHPPTRAFLSGTAGAYVLLCALDNAQSWASGLHAAFVLGMTGCALVLAGLALGLARPGSGPLRQDADRPG